MKTTILPTTTTKNRTKTKFKSALGIAGQLLTWASMNRPPWRRGLFLIAFILACFALAPQTRAVCQDACLTNSNTVQGDDALISLTTGADNTAIGQGALNGNTTGDFNTAIGSNALLANTIGTSNTASGVNALGSNTTGSYNTATGLSALISNTEGGANTATGVEALFNNTTGSNNTANGVIALWSNTTGFSNTATGVAALYSNTTGFDNTATGLNALVSNTEGFQNVAIGTSALGDNGTGSNNVAIGIRALLFNTTGINNTATGQGALILNTTGSRNVAIGRHALDNNPTGSRNIALGYFAGTNLTTGDNNIDIGNEGVASESDTIRIGTEGTQTNAYIAGIYLTPVAKGLVVKVDSTGHLGTVGSSGRFKEQIKPMGNASEAILALKPITFRYKKEIDPERTPEFGLVAEDVEKVNPDLVVRGADGKVYTVRYDAVNAMLLNEFLKQHRQVQEQEVTITQLKSTVAKQEATAAHQQTEIEALTAGLQKVSAQVQMSRSAPQIVLNNK